MATGDAKRFLHAALAGVRTDEGLVNAPAFTIRHDSPSFAPKISDAEIARNIAEAEGFVGPCWTIYLKQPRHYEKRVSQTR